MDVGLWCGALLVSDASPVCGCGLVLMLLTFCGGALLVSDAADFLWFLVLLPPHSVRRCSFISGFGFYSNTGIDTDRHRPTWRLPKGWRVSV